MLKPKFPAKVAHGKLEFKNPTTLWAHIGKFRPEDELEVTVEKRKLNRSQRQNRYYWGVVLDLIAKETGHTTEELHEIYKRMFLPRKVIEYKKREIPVPTSTTDCDITDFHNYIERVRAEAASMNINVPDPNEIDY
jgi:hypothetical protein